MAAAAQRCTNDEEGQESLFSANSSLSLGIQPISVDSILKGAPCFNPRLDRHRARCEKHWIRRRK